MNLLSCSSMTITYQSPQFSPSLVVARYVSADGEGFWFCELNAARYDVRQGRVSGEVLPAEVREAALALRGTWPACVAWPL
jgi:hypothetical protein